MKIQVTQSDIDEGMQSSPTGCPIARAIQRDGYKNVFVDDTHIIFETKEGVEYRRYNLEPETTGWIGDFDEDKSLVEPFELVLAHDLCPRV